jgi:hypothetical protein
MKAENFRKRVTTKKKAMRHELKEQQSTDTRESTTGSTTVEHTGTFYGGNSTI